MQNVDFFRTAHMEVLVYCRSARTQCWNTVRMRTALFWQPSSLPKVRSPTAHKALQTYSSKAVSSSAEAKKQSKSVQRAQKQSKAVQKASENVEQPRSNPESLPKQWECTQKMLEHSRDSCKIKCLNQLNLYFYEASMLEYSSGVRFSGVKDIAKMTQSVLEYKMLIRTPHAGIKQECACKLGQFLPLCAYFLLEHGIFSKDFRQVQDAGIQRKSYGNTVKK